MNRGQCKYLCDQCIRLGRAQTHVDGQLADAAAKGGETKGREKQRLGGRKVEWRNGRER